MSGTVVDPMGGYVPKAGLVLTDARKKGAEVPETLLVSGEDLRRDVTLQLARTLL